MAFPAFAQQLYAFPIDATGKAVCANCHLAEAPIRLSGPSAVFASSIFDLLIEIPTLLTASQVSPAGDLVDLNVGGVVVLPEGFGKSVAADSNIFTPFSAAEPNVFVFGPVPASEYATAVLSVLAPDDARSLSFPIVVAGNRGRGQLYPDGSPSNNGGFRSPCNGWLGRVHISREGPSLGLWTRQAAVQVAFLPAGVDILARRSCQLGARLSIDAVLASNPNVGGVGQACGFYVQVVASIFNLELGSGPRPSLELCDFHEMGLARAALARNLPRGTVWNHVSPPAKHFWFGSEPLEGGLTQEPPGFSALLVRTKVSVRRTGKWI